MRSPFLRPVANRDASNVATAPPAKRARNSAASSTVTSPRPSPSGERTFLHERLGQAAHRRDRVAEQVLREVDDVGADVAERAGAGELALQAPDEREFRIDDPVLQVHRADVPHRPEPAVGDQPAGELDRRDAAVVERDHRAQRRAPSRRPPPSPPPPRACSPAASRTGRASRPRAPRSRSRRALSPGVETSINPMSSRSIDPAPVRLHRRPPQLLGGCRHRVGRAPADARHRRLERHIEHARDVAPRVRVRASHERVADHADADRLRRRSSTGIDLRRKPRNYPAVLSQNACFGGRRRLPRHRSDENASSKRAPADGKSSFRTNASASGAPCSRSIPASSHSIDSGPS